MTTLYPHEVVMERFYNSPIWNWIETNAINIVVIFLVVFLLVLSVVVSHPNIITDATPPPIPVGKRW